jgi:hypothetical protein
MRPPRLLPARPNKEVDYIVARASTLRPHLGVVSFLHPNLLCDALDPPLSSHATCLSNPPLLLFCLKIVNPKIPRICPHASAPSLKSQDDFSEPAAQDFLSAPFPRRLFPAQTSIEIRLVSAGPMRFYLDIVQKREEKRRKENTEEENTSDHLVAQTPTSSAPCKQTNQMSQHTAATKPTNKLKSIVSGVLKAVNQVHRRRGGMQNILLAA